jgi:hypothetical protein
MKHNRLSLSVLVLLLFTFSCSVGNDTDSLVLSNGTVVTAADRALLENLRPEFNSLIASVAGEAAGKALEAGGDAVIPDGTSAELIAQIEAFMKDKLGEDYEKYIVRGEYSNPQEIHVDDPFGGVNASWVSVPVGSDAAYQYYMAVNGAWTTYPWGSLNWADTAFDRVLIATGGKDKINAYYMRSCVKDSVTPNGKWAAAYNTHLVTIGGNLRGGFFPPAPSGLITTHQITDSRVTGGFVSRSFSWGW